MIKKALITGVTGQDGSYLSEFLLNKGYEVHGITDCVFETSIDRISHLIRTEGFNLHCIDTTNLASFTKLVESIKPDEIYNLAAQSHVDLSFDYPELTKNANAAGLLRVLEAVRVNQLGERCRIFNASSSDVFGKAKQVPQTEDTPFYPCSPYGVTALYSYHIVKEYRDHYNMYCCSGILYNHESERRGEDFVSRKITKAAARIAKGEEKCLYLGNLDSSRDWGYAKDYVECMWLMLQQEAPDDYIVASGVQHTVREFATLAFRYVGMDIQWEGEGENEVGIDSKTGNTVIAVSKDLYRPIDATNLCGDPSKALEKLAWYPSTSFEELVSKMVKHDILIRK